MLFYTPHSSGNYGDGWIPDSVLREIEKQKKKKKDQPQEPETPLKYPTLPTPETPINNPSEPPKEKFIHVDNDSKSAEPIPLWDATDEERAQREADAAAGQINGVITSVSEAEGGYVSWYRQGVSKEEDARREKELGGRPVEERLRTRINTYETDNGDSLYEVNVITADNLAEATSADTEVWAIRDGNYIPTTLASGGSAIGADKLYNAQEGQNYVIFNKKTGKLYQYAHTDEDDVYWKGVYNKAMTNTRIAYDEAQTTYYETATGLIQQQEALYDQLRAFGYEILSDEEFKNMSEEEQAAYEARQMAVGASLNSKQMDEVAAITEQLDALGVQLTDATTVYATTAQDLDSKAAKYKDDSLNLGVNLSDAVNYNTAKEIYEDAIKVNTGDMTPGEFEILHDMTYDEDTLEIAANTYAVYNEMYVNSGGIIMDDSGMIDNLNEAAAHIMDNDSTYRDAMATVGGATGLAGVLSHFAPKSDGVDTFADVVRRQMARWKYDEYYDGSNVISDLASYCLNYGCIGAPVRVISRTIHGEHKSIKDSALDTIGVALNTLGELGNLTAIPLTASLMADPLNTDYNQVMYVPPTAKSQSCYTFKWQPWMKGGGLMTYNLSTDVLSAEMQHEAYADIYEKTGGIYDPKVAADEVKKLYYFGYIHDPISTGAKRTSHVVNRESLYYAADSASMIYNNYSGAKQYALQQQRWIDASVNGEGDVVDADGNVYIPGTMATWQEWMGPLSQSEFSLTPYPIQIPFKVADYETNAMEDSYTLMDGIGSFAADMLIGFAFDWTNWIQIGTGAVNDVIKEKSFYDNMSDAISNAMYRGMEASGIVIDGTDDVIRSQIDDVARAAVRDNNVIVNKVWGSAEDLSKYLDKSVANATAELFTGTKYADAAHGIIDGNLNILTAFDDAPEELFNVARKNAMLKIANEAKLALSSSGAAETIWKQAAPAVLLARGVNGVNDAINKLQWGPLSGAGFMIKKASGLPPVKAVGTALKTYIELGTPITVKNTVLKVASMMTGIGNATKKLISDFKMKHMPATELEKALVNVRRLEASYILDIIANTDEDVVRAARISKYFANDFYAETNKQIARIALDDLGFIEGTVTYNKLIQAGTDIEAYRLERAMAKGFDNVPDYLESIKKEYSAAINSKAFLNAFDDIVRQDRKRIIRNGIKAENARLITVNKELQAVNYSFAEFAAKYGSDTHDKLRELIDAVGQNYTVGVGEADELYSELMKASAYDSNLFADLKCLTEYEIEAYYRSVFDATGSLPSSYKVGAIVENSLSTYGDLKAPNVRSAICDYLIENSNINNEQLIRLTDSIITDQATAIEQANATDTIVSIMASKGYALNSICSDDAVKAFTEVLDDSTALGEEFVRMRAAAEEFNDVHMLAKLNDIEEQAEKTIQTHKFMNDLAQSSISSEGRVLLQDAYAGSSDAINRQYARYLRNDPRAIDNAVDNLIQRSTQHGNALKVSTPNFRSYGFNNLDIEANARAMANSGLVEESDEYLDIFYSAATATRNDPYAISFCTRDGKSILLAYDDVDFSGLNSAATKDLTGFTPAELEKFYNDVLSSVSDKDYYVAVQKELKKYSDIAAKSGRKLRLISCNADMVGANTDRFLTGFLRRTNITLSQTHFYNIIESMEGAADMFRYTDFEVEELRSIIESLFSNSYHNNRSVIALDPFSVNPLPAKMFGEDSQLYKLFDELNQSRAIQNGAMASDLDFVINTSAFNDLCDELLIDPRTHLNQILSDAIGFDMYTLKNDIKLDHVYDWFELNRFAPNLDIEADFYARAVAASGIVDNLETTMDVIRYADIDDISTEDLFKFKDQLVTYYSQSSDCSEDLLLNLMYEYNGNDKQKLLAMILVYSRDNNVDFRKAFNAMMQYGTEGVNERILNKLYTSNVDRCIYGTSTNVQYGRGIERLSEALAPTDAIRETRATRELMASAQETARTTSLGRNELDIEKEVWKIAGVNSTEDRIQFLNKTKILDEYEGNMDGFVEQFNYAPEGTDLNAVNNLRTDYTSRYTQYYNLEIARDILAAQDDSYLDMVLLTQCRNAYVIDLDAMPDIDTRYEFERLAATRSERGYIVQNRKINGSECLIISRDWKKFLPEQLKELYEGAADLKPRTDIHVNTRAALDASIDKDVAKAEAVIAERQADIDRLEDLARIGHNNKYAGLEEAAELDERISFAITEKNSLYDNVSDMWEEISAARRKSTENAQAGWDLVREINKEAKEDNAKLWDDFRKKSGALWDSFKDTSAEERAYRETVWESFKNTSAEAKAERAQMWADFKSSSNELWDDFKATAAAEGEYRGNLWDSFKTTASEAKAERAGMWEGFKSSSEEEKQFRSDLWDTFKSDKDAIYEENKQLWEDYSTHSSDVKEANDQIYGEIKGIGEDIKSSSDSISELFKELKAIDEGADVTKTELWKRFKVEIADLNVKSEEQLSFLWESYKASLKQFGEETKAMWNDYRAFKNNIFKNHKMLVKGNPTINSLVEARKDAYHPLFRAIKNGEDVDANTKKILDMLAADIRDSGTVKKSTIDEMLTTIADAKAAKGAARKDLYDMYKGTSNLLDATRESDKAWKSLSITHTMEARSELFRRREELFRVLNDNNADVRRLLGITREEAEENLRRINELLGDTFEESRRSYKRVQDMYDFTVASADRNKELVGEAYDSTKQLDEASRARVSEAYGKTKTTSEHMYDFTAASVDQNKQFVSDAYDQAKKLDADSRTRVGKAFEDTKAASQDMYDAYKGTSQYIYDVRSMDTADIIKMIEEDKAATEEFVQNLIEKIKALKEGDIADVQDVLHDMYKLRKALEFDNNAIASGSRNFDAYLLKAQMELELAQRELAEINAARTISFDTIKSLDSYMSDVSTSSYSISATKQLMNDDWAKLCDEWAGEYNIINSPFENLYGKGVGYVSNIAGDGNVARALGSNGNLFDKCNNAFRTTFEDIARRSDLSGLIADTSITDYATIKADFTRVVGDMSDDDFMKHLKDTNRRVVKVSRVEDSRGLIHLNVEDITGDTIKVWNTQRDGGAVRIVSAQDARYLEHMATANKNYNKYFMTTKAVSGASRYMQRVRSNFIYSMLYLGNFLGTGVRNVIDSTTKAVAVLGGDPEFFKNWLNTQSMQSEYVQDMMRIYQTMDSTTPEAIDKYFAMLARGEVDDVFKTTMGQDELQKMYIVFNQIGASSETANTRLADSIAGLERSKVLDSMGAVNTVERNRVCNVFNRFKQKNWAKETRYDYSAEFDYEKLEKMLEKKGLNPEYAKYYNKWVATSTSYDGALKNAANKSFAATNKAVFGMAEDNVRTSMLLTLINKGVDVEEAAEYVVKTQFDYGSKVQGSVGSLFNFFFPFMDYQLYNAMFWMDSVDDMSLAGQNLMKIYARNGFDSRTNTSDMYTHEVMLEYMKALKEKEAKRKAEEEEGYDSEIVDEYQRGTMAWVQQQIEASAHSGIFGYKGVNADNIGYAGIDLNNGFYLNTGNSLLDVGEFLGYIGDGFTSLAKGEVPAFIEDKLIAPIKTVKGLFNYLEESKPADFKEYIATSTEYITGTKEKNYADKKLYDFITLIPIVGSIFKMVTYTFPRSFVLNGGEALLAASYGGKQTHEEIINTMFQGARAVGLGLVSGVVGRYYESKPYMTRKPFYQHVDADGNLITWYSLTGKQKNEYRYVVGGSYVPKFPLTVKDEASLYWRLVNAGADEKVARKIMNGVKATGAPEHNPYYYYQDKESGKWYPRTGIMNETIIDMMEEGYTPEEILQLLSSMGEWYDTKHHKLMSGAEFVAEFNEQAFFNIYENLPDYIKYDKEQYSKLMEYYHRLGYATEEAWLLMMKGDKYFDATGTLATLTPSDRETYEYFLRTEHKYAQDPDFLEYYQSLPDYIKYEAGAFGRTLKYLRQFYDEATAKGMIAGGAYYTVDGRLIDCSDLVNTKQIRQKTAFQDDNGYWHKEGDFQVDGYWFHKGDNPYLGLGSFQNYWNSLPNYLRFTKGAWSTTNQVLKEAGYDYNTRMLAMQQGALAVQVDPNSQEFKDAVARQKFVPITEEVWVDKEVPLHECKLINGELKWVDPRTLDTVNKTMDFYADGGIPKNFNFSTAMTTVKVKTTVTRYVADKGQIIGSVITDSSGKAWIIVPCPDKPAPQPRWHHRRYSRPTGGDNFKGHWTPYYHKARTVFKPVRRQKAKWNMKPMTIKYSNVSTYSKQHFMQGQSTGYQYWYKWGDANVTNHRTRRSGYPSTYRNYRARNRNMYKDLYAKYGTSRMNMRQNIPGYSNAAITRLRRNEFRNRLTDASVRLGKTSGVNRFARNIKQNKR